MKKIYVSLLLLASLGYTANAQISEARLPQSMLSQIGEQYIPQAKFALPDWKTAKERFEKEESNGFSRPFLFGLPVATNLSFPASGTLVTLPDGTQVWRAKVKIEGAPAMGFYYDKFELPEGVSYFLSNENGKHILGAYTSKNNSDDQLFANEAVQGELVNLELNIEPGVNLSDIKLHIDKVLVYFRSYEYLNQYLITDNDLGKPTDVDNLHLEGSGSTCGINAICPLGVNYPVARKSTVQTVYIDGLCSATMVNNTGNTTANCKQYLLTATHCEGSNSTTNTTYSQMLIRYNFEKKQCVSGPAAQVNTLTGAFFRARSNYVETNPPTINGDFLLLEVKDKIPDTWDVYFAGWNKSATVPATLTYPKRYIGFHHPAGDVKKVSVSNDISPDGEAGGSMGPGTHWQIFPIDSGGVEGGSSGSGLFDGEGRLIGIASVAGNPNPACTATGQIGGDPANFYRFVDYSKLSLDWDYSLDGTDNFRQLKPWLDPANSGVVTLDAVKSNCTSTGSGITTRENNVLDNAIAIAPNPTTNGKITATVNFSEPAPLIVEIYNIAGAKQATYNVGKALRGTYTFDLSGYANGMYLLKFNNGNAIATKKVMLAH
jgi:hypothetical protein